MEGITVVVWSLIYKILNAQSVLMPESSFKTTTYWRSTPVKICTEEATAAVATGECGADFYYMVEDSIIFYIIL